MRQQRSPLCCTAFIQLRYQSRAIIIFFNLCHCSHGSLYSVIFSSPSAANLKLLPLLECISNVRFSLFLGPSSGSSVEGNGTIFGAPDCAILCVVASTLGHCGTDYVHVFSAQQQWLHPLLLGMVASIICLAFWARQQHSHPLLPCAVAAAALITCPASGHSHNSCHLSSRQQRQLLSLPLPRFSIAETLVLGLTSASPAGACWATSPAEPAAHHFQRGKNLKKVEKKGEKEVKGNKEKYKGT